MVRITNEHDARSHAGGASAPSTRQRTPSPRREPLRLLEVRRTNADPAREHRVLRARPLEIAGEPFERVADPIRRVLGSSAQTCAELVAEVAREAPCSHVPDALDAVMDGAAQKL